MKGFVALLIAGVLSCYSMAYAQSDTEKEVKQTVLERWEYRNTKLRTNPEFVSKHGTLEFWSSGGLLQDEIVDSELDVHNVKVKHINVITLVEGQAAVAHFYLEGLIKEKGTPLVSNYLVRATAVFVKEDGKWKRRAGHWSPITGGSGIISSVAEPTK